MAIEDRNLATGTKLWARYKNEVHTAEVVETEGKHAFRLSDGREFKSPSAAGTAITGKACNGWAFWSVGEPTEKVPKAEKPAGSKRTVNAVPKPEREPRARKEKNIRATGTATRSQSWNKPTAVGNAASVAPASQRAKRPRRTWRRRTRRKHFATNQQRAGPYRACFSRSGGCHAL